MGKRAEYFYEFGPFRLDPAERLLLRAGKVVPLTPKLFDTLLALVENSGHVMLKDDLLERVWPDSFVEEGSLTRNVSHLRKLLGEDANGRDFIETLPKRGYRFAAEVAQVGNLETDLIVRRRTRAHIVTHEEEVDEDATDDALLGAGARQLPVALDAALLELLASRPNNLSAQPLQLIGRETEVSEALALFEQDEVRLLTLTGPGGTGKTRLALHLATRLLESFKDGVFFIDLAPLSDAELVASTIAQSLGLKESGASSMSESLKQFLRGKQMLLVLDNFEQVLAASSLVTKLLLSCTKLKVLVTSRAPLRVASEQEFPVQPLALPDTARQSSAAELAANPSVRLFVERARAVQSGFQLTEANAQALIQICIRLDGLPLALELAAARIRLLPPAPLLARLETRLKLLTSGAEDAPARHQTMRGTIAWSYDLLSEGEQRLFRRLSVFVGGLTIDEAEAVCNAAGDLVIDIFNGLTSLLDNSLLRKVELGENEPRFKMLETVREYGLERLAESGESESLQKHYADFFVRLAEEAQPELSGARQAEWLEKLGHEHDNFRAVLEWAFTHNAEAALRITRSLWQFWFVRGHLTEGSMLLKRTFAVRCDSLPDVRGKALVGAGFLERLRGDLVASRAYFEEAETIGRKLNDADLISSSLNGLGILAGAAHDYNAGRVYLEEGLAVSRAACNKRFVGLLLNNLGENARNRGDFEGARKLYEEGLAIQREIGNKRIIAIGLGNLGRVAYHQGQYAAARTYYAESMTLNRELGDQHSIAGLLDGFAGLALRNKHGERAAQLLGAATSLRESVGSDIDSADLSFNQRIMSDVRATLSAQAFNKAFAEGRAMTFEQAVVRASESETATQASDSFGVHTLAVLPFRTFTEGAGDYLGLGLTDALITQLGNTRQIVVRPTSAVRKYAEACTDSVTAGSELGVDAVLEGSIQRAGERLRVTVQMVSVRGGAQMWADKFEVEKTDIFAVQDSIAEQVARALALKLSGRERKLLTKRYTENVEAYQKYLKGRYFWNKRSVEGFKKSIEYFEQTIEIDPTYALAFAGLADCYNLLPHWGVLSSKACYPRAKAAATRALEIDDELAEGHASLGYARLYYDWDWPGAKESLLRAIELKPNYGSARQWHAGGLAALGQFDEALVEMTLALELDPLSLSISENMGVLLYLARRYEQAIAQMRSTLEVAPQLAIVHCDIGYCYEQLGKRAESIKEFEKAAEIACGNTRILSGLGQAYAVAGERDKALRIIEELHQLSAQEYVSPYSFALIYIGLGEKDEAFAWLDKAYEQRYPGLVFLGVDPEMDSLRSDSRFQNLLNRVGLAG